MSKILSAPFGHTKARYSRMGEAGNTFFHVVASGEQAESFVAFVEFLYDTRAQITFREETVVLRFTSLPNRSRAGVRVAARCCQMQIDSCRIWY